MAKQKAPSVPVNSPVVKNSFTRTIKVVLPCLIVIAGIFALLAHYRVVPSTENFLSKGVSGKVIASLSISCGLLLFIIGYFHQNWVSSLQSSEDSLAQMEADLQAEIKKLTHEIASLRKKISTIEAFILRNPQLRSTCERFKQIDGHNIINVAAPKKECFNMNDSIDRWTYLRHEKHCLEVDLQELELFFQRNPSVLECYQETLKALRAEPPCVVRKNLLASSTKNIRDVFVLNICE